MDASNLNPSFDPDLLSTREREVLVLASHGRTDEQIAQALDLSLSTVSSYWGRIRGKLGQQNRTELVAALIRHEEAAKRACLVSDIDRLRELQPTLQNELDQSRADNAALRGDSWHLLALDHVPDAILVITEAVIVEYANLQAGHLYAAEPGELVGLPIWELAIPTGVESRRDSVEAYFAFGNATRSILGIERAFYARRRDGSNLRAVLVIERFATPQGEMAVVTIRPYLADLEAMLQSLRQPYDIH